MYFTSYPSLRGEASFQALHSYFDKRDRHEWVLPVSELSIDPETGFLARGSDSFAMTAHAGRLLSKSMGVPANFIEREPNELAAEIFNFKLPTAPGNTKLIFEVIDDKPVVVGFLPPDIESVPMDLLIGELEESAHGLDLKGWAMDSQGLSARFISPSLVAEPKVGDLVYSGLDILNYENETKGLDVRGALFRLSCTNGAVIPEISYGRYIKKEKFKSAGAIVDAAVGYFRSTVFEVANFAESLKSLPDHAFELPEENAVKFVRKPLHVLKVGPQYDESVVDAMHVEDDTVFGLYNAVTRLGRDSHSRDVKMMFEKAGYLCIQNKDAVIEAYDQAWEAHAANN